MVFQLTIRAASCREIADDADEVKRVTDLYWKMEKGSTPTAILFPWLPVPARKRRNDATMDLYLLIKKHVDKRKADGRVEADAMQVLLDEGDGENDIVHFIVSTLFAGILNTGIMSSWIVLFLHANPEWKAKATAEVKSFIAKYASNSTAGSQSVSAQLAQVPPNVWDEEMPVLDVCLRETIRVIMTGSMLRRAVPLPGDETLTIEGHKIKPGTFLAFPMSSVHQNPDLYPDPEKWDPDRFARGEDKKEQWAYVGWGVGRHPCLGMRFAKIEVKVILALFLTRFEYELVDGAGKKMTTLPAPQRDNLYQVPPVKPVYVKYKRVAA